MSIDDENAHLVRRIRVLTDPLTPIPTGMEPSLQPTDGIRAVVFDVYGTLVISGSGDIGLMASTASANPFTDAWAAAELPDTALPSGFDGPAALRAQIRANHAQHRAAGTIHPEVDIVAIWNELTANLGIALDDSRLRRLALEYELRVNPVWPMPDLIKTLTALARRGFTLGIVSNAQFYTPLMLRMFLGRSLESVGFDRRCCSWSYLQGVAKPATAAYSPTLAGLRRHHGIRPEQVLYLGNDIRNDIAPARALGCRTALFAGDLRSLRLHKDNSDLQEAKPDRVVTTLGQIAEHLLPPP